MFPAASIIDRELEAVRIGDRSKPLADKTRERIRRGLDRLAREPFAIRLMHGGAPRPLTLPVITLTRRHDMAMVTPVAGNTFERTPGNRARDARLVPLDTVHTTLDRAMVVPPMGGVDPRPDSDPLPTQTTSTRAAVVHPRGTAELQRHGDVRPITDPVHTVRAGGQHHALVYANRAGNALRDADLEAGNSILTSDTQAIVMRNNESRGDNGQMCTPDHEPVRTFTTTGHQSLVMANTEHGVPRPAERTPAQTLRTEGGLAVVVPYTRTGEARWAQEQPMPTMTTRDRAAVLYTEEDIDSCLFRMFALHEIAGAMVMVDHVDGNPYVVTGNKREQMSQLGNAVTPPAARELIARVLETLS